MLKLLQENNMKISEEFERPYIPQYIVRIFAACCALASFGLFFADAAQDSSGNGIAAYLIAFDNRSDGFYFNARAFIAYFIPLFAAVIYALPLKSKNASYVAALLLAGAGIAQFLMPQIFLSGLSDEVAAQYAEKGIKLASPAIAAGVLTFVSAATGALAVLLINKKVEEKNSPTLADRNSEVSDDTDCDTDSAGIREDKDGE